MICIRHIDGDGYISNMEASARTDLTESWQTIDKNTGNRLWTSRSSALLKAKDATRPLKKAMSPDWVQHLFSKASALITPGTGRRTGLCLSISMATFLAAASVCAQEAKMALQIHSPTFVDGGEIPSKYTCEGNDITPPLKWEGVPGNARSLVLIVDDPDAPDPAAPRMIWVHWLLYNLPADLSGLPEGVTAADLPAGTQEGLNDWKRTGYGGPCPPIGRHRYFYKLYALDTVLKGLSKPTRAQLESAMKGHILAQAQLVGTYRKGR